MKWVLLKSVSVLCCWFIENMHIIKHFNLSFESSFYLKGTRKGFAQEASNKKQTKSTKLRSLFESALLI